MKILLAYDGSPSSKIALADLTRAGLPAQAEIIILTYADVFIPPPADKETAFVSTYTRQLAEKAKLRMTTVLAEANQIVQEAESFIALHFPGWTVTKRVKADVPAWGILKEADAWKPDLIVLGSHGKGALGRMTLGSVSHKVLTHAPCSVRIARGSDTITGIPLRLLVGVDGSTDSLETARLVASRNWPKDASVRVVAVADLDLPHPLPLSDSAPRWMKENDQNDMDWLQRMVETLSEPMRQTFTHVAAEVKSGDPRQVLLHEAQSWGADCVFVGTRGLSGVERFFLGSVSLALAMHAPCSVEVIR